MQRLLIFLTLVSTTHAVHAMEVSAPTDPMQQLITALQQVVTTQSGDHALQEQLKNLHLTVNCNPKIFMQQDADLAQHSTLEQNADVQFECTQDQATAQKLASQNSAYAQQEQKQEQALSATQDVKNQSISSALGRTFDWLLGTKIGLAITGCGILYVYSRRSHKNKPPRWGRWQSHIPLNTLQEMPQQERAQQLLHAIERDLISSRTLNDPYAPLRQFIKDIDAEEQQLKERLTWSDRAKKMRITRAMSLTQSKVAQLTEQLKRVQLLKRTFREWVAARNLALLGESS